jgi:hypothetical protein
MCFRGDNVVPCHAFKHHIVFYSTPMHPRITSFVTIRGTVSPVHRWIFGV